MGIGPEAPGGRIFERNLVFLCFLVSYAAPGCFFLPSTQLMSIGAMMRPDDFRIVLLKPWTVELCCYRIWFWIVACAFWIDSAIRLAQGIPLATIVQFVVG